jgi:hypothetical protein
LRVKKFLNQILGRFPSALPIGTKDFHKFADSIIQTYDIPDLRSYKHAIASMIMHLEPLTIRKPKHYFALSIKKAQANEIAFHVIQTIKEEQQAEEKKLAEEKLAEVTAQQTESSVAESTG